ncbi:MAG TPA: nitrous oxide-stimulated promoter family protein [Deltaproteobacteria bacterium]|nr:nitrous oxide-stimulated promoter family protein [Deltaproteobacteria bacterium]HQB38749.1 nitrous oxide-stimulated promoter family protein [Deltaproteobacteria bacterium]
METFTGPQIKDIRLLGKFMEVYCLGRHGLIERRHIRHPALNRQRLLCPDCADLLLYAIKRRIMCPFKDKKPSCKHCTVHCYAAIEREHIRQVMAYAGRKLLLQGRLKYLWHYFF